VVWLALRVKTSIAAHSAAEVSFSLVPAADAPGERERITNRPSVLPVSAWIGVSAHLLRCPWKALWLSVEICKGYGIVSSLPPFIVVALLMVCCVSGVLPMTDLVTRRLSSDLCVFSAHAEGSAHFGFIIPWCHDAAPYAR